MQNIRRNKVIRVFVFSTRTVWSIWWWGCRLVRKLWVWSACMAEIWYY